jgi:chromate transporter
MPPDLPPAADAAPDIPISATPSLIVLFTAFAKMSLAGFGGVLVWARRAIVDQHQWMTAEQFNETFALCHFLPGPNVVNLSVVFGSRFRGFRGGLAAFAGLLGPPVIIVTALAALYSHYRELEVLRHILAGVSCVAVGLLISAVLRMAVPLLVTAAVFVAVGVARLPLPIVLLAAVPLSIAVRIVMQWRTTT